MREAPATERSALPGRAGIAMLTLQLRAARQEAVAAEAREAAADRDKVRDKLRAQLGPLLDDRRHGFEAELIQVRAEAAASIAAARRAAAAMVTRDYSLLDRTVAPAAEPTPTAEPIAVAPVLTPLVIVPADDPIPVGEILHWFDDDPPTVMSNVVTRSPDLPTLTAGDASHAQLSTTNVAIDADAFAQAFATAFGALLDERFSNWGPGIAGPQVLSAAPAPATVKPSFWTHARHPDVLLIGLATIIMLIVVAAWLA